MTPGECNSGETRRVFVDTHVHTLASYDAELPPERLLDRARTAGLDAVVVTDHDAGVDAVAARAASRDIITITGCEVSTADGHLLAIGVDTAPERGRSLAETVGVIHEQGGLAVVPHPFQRSRHGVSRATLRRTSAVDGIEIYNAHTLTNLRNRQAESFAAGGDYPAFAGSDAHRASGVGHAATAVALTGDGPVTADRIVSAMRAGQTAAVWQQAAKWEYLTKAVESAKRRTLSFL
jgi:predicted metal-dependent phosphoesterase TrpH